jgi:hypothetical protein
VVPPHAEGRNVVSLVRDALAARVGGRRAILEETNWESGRAHLLAPRSAWSNLQCAARALGKA